MPKGALAHSGEEDGHTEQKEQNPQNDLQKEASVLGVSPSAGQGGNAPECV